MTLKTQAHLLKDLELLINTGLGVAPIAPGLSWFSETGVPEGFYQRGSTREAELLFMNRYKELFAGPNEYTPFWSLRNKRQGIIHAGQASRPYLHSNTFNLFIKPSRCHFLLCVLVDLEGVPRLAGRFFKIVANPFYDSDAQKLAMLIPSLRCAIGTCQRADDKHCSARTRAYAGFGRRHAG